MTVKPHAFRWPLQGILAAAWKGIENPKAVVWIIVGYCVLHWAVRLGLSPVYSVDEAEQMLFSQDLSLGYRFRHPPLITWITWGVQQVFGLDRMAFFAMKYAIMAGGFIAFFYAALVVLKNCRLAAFATAAFTMTYTVGYYPHLDLMHTVLLTAMLGAGLYALTQVLELGRWRDYLLYGAVTALGILSKYVYGLFPLGVVLGVVLIPAFRARVSAPKALASLAVTLALLAPYAWWAVSFDYSLVELGQTMTRPAGTEPGLLAGWLNGTGMLAFSLLEFTLPFSLIFLALFWRHLRIPDAAAFDDDGKRLANYLRLFEIVMLTGAGLMLLAVFAFGAADFKGRWMHQVLMPLPIYLFGRMILASKTNGLPLRGLRIYGGLAVGIAALVVAARILSFEMNGASCKKCWEYQPFERYAKGLRDKGFVKGTIIVDHMYVGGNLRPFFPESRILIHGYPLSVFPEADGPGHCAVAWLNETREIPGRLDPLRARLGIDPLPHHHQRLRVRAKVHPKSNRWFSMNYVFMPDGTADCR